jgi:hypothetical protein
MTDGKIRHIDLFITQYKVSDFITWGNNKIVDLTPNFQRRPVWKSLAKSYLIDTIVRGLPIPIIILRDRKTDIETLAPIREVVDGQQRLRTLFTYIKPSILEGYQPERDDFVIQDIHNKEIAGKKFRELPDWVQQNILDYQFSVHVLPIDVDDREVVQIFQRLNATGYRLSPQEIRNSEYLGKFRVLMNRLASDYLHYWRKWKIFTESSIARMQEVELTSEFAQMMLRGVLGKNQRSIDSLYKQKNENFPEHNEIARRYRIVMEEISEKFGEDIPQLPYRRRTLFYSLFTHVYDLIFGIGSELDSRKPGKLSQQQIVAILKKGLAIKEETAPKGVMDAISKRTTHPSSRNKVLQYLKGE